MIYSYRTNGTCSQAIKFEVVDGKVINISFSGGCNGNLKGIAKLAEGMDIDLVIEKLKGIRCGFKKTSCPDQLARALSEAKEKDGD